jgi:4-hydroxybenzoyl-CoA thioesterase/acyl-CoA thioester hydrolase
MSNVFTTRRRVEFRDTDMAGIVHFSVFMTYMEAAEHELLRSVGLGVIGSANGRSISWPRVHTACNYRSALRYDEVVEIAVRVARLGHKSVTYAFDFTRDGVAIADGTITAACCEWPAADQRPVAMEIPAMFREKLAAFVT